MLRSLTSPVGPLCCRAPSPSCAPPTAPGSGDVGIRGGGALPGQVGRGRRRRRRGARRRPAPRAAQARPQGAAVGVGRRQRRRRHPRLPDQQGVGWGPGLRQRRQRAGSAPPQPPRRQQSVEAPPPTAAPRALRLRHPVLQDALLACGEAAKLFIHYLTATANDSCRDAKRQVRGQPPTQAGLAAALGQSPAITAGLQRPRQRARS